MLTAATKPFKPLVEHATRTTKIVGKKLKVVGKTIDQGVGKVGQGIVDGARNFGKGASAMGFYLNQFEPGKGFEEYTCQNGSGERKFDSRLARGGYHALPAGTAYNNCANLKYWLGGKRSKDCQKKCCKFIWNGDTEQGGAWFGGRGMMGKEQKKYMYRHECKVGGGTTDWDNPAWVFPKGQSLEQKVNNERGKGSMGRSKSPIVTDTRGNRLR